MEKYEPLGVVGEGSYGIVLKCKDRGDGKTVAIKKFIDSEDDLNVRKIALREIRLLKKLRHENLVNLLEVFRRRKHLYLVFEFIDHTLLEQLEQTNHGLDDDTCRKYIFQILRGLGFCHDNSVIHRDVKPENVLVSKNGIVKLCDFGFARTLCGPGDIYTDYVATRWYRAPELLVGDVAYGKEVDIWAVGCLFAEMSTGEPLFPGDSDIDQLFLIAQCLGRLAKRHLNIMSKNSAFRGFQYPKSRHGSTTSTNSKKGMSSKGGARGGPSGATFSSHLNKNSGKKRQSPYGQEPPPTESATSIFASRFPSWTEEAVYFLTVCLDPEPTSRPTCNSLMRMPYFTQDNFPIKFLSELNTKLQLEGRPPITSSTIRKRRNVVAANGNSSVANVSPAFPTQSRPMHLNATSQRSTFFLPQGGSTEDVHKLNQQQSRPPFQSNNLVNQTHFSTSTNLTRQHTFIVGGKDSKNVVLGRKSTTDGSQSRIPVSLSRKSSEEALNSKSISNIPAVASAEESQSQSFVVTTKEKRFSVSQTPKKFSLSVSEEMGTTTKTEPLTHSLPVTTLTFNLGPHNTSYNGTTYSTSTVPVPVRAKSPTFPNTSTFPLGNQNFRRSSPGRTRKKVSLVGGGGGNVNQHFQGYNNNIPSSYYNNRSPPIGVSVLGSSMGMSKATITTTWSSSGNGEPFLPRMTPKNGISFNSIVVGGGSGMDENNPNSFPTLGNGNNGNTFMKKRERVEQLQPLPQSRRSSISTDLGNIKQFLIPPQQERELTSPSAKSTTDNNTLPIMQQ